MDLGYPLSGPGLESYLDCLLKKSIPLPLLLRERNLLILQGGKQ